MNGGGAVRIRLSAGRKRVVADRPQILAAALALGEREGWGTVTIRALAEALHYKAPIIYEHFVDKCDLLTQLAVEGFGALEAALGWDLPPNGETRILAMLDHYWDFMLTHPQWYRLMHGMDGVSLDKAILDRMAQSVCGQARAVVEEWLNANGTQGTDLEATTDEIWAYLHGMAVLHLERGIPFDRAQVRSGSLKLLLGTKALTLRSATDDCDEDG
jgi:AcrR family transcriptional regulator